MKIRCNRCGEEKEETEYPFTSRKYDNADTGFSSVYRYRHKICGKCRYKQLKEYKQRIKRKDQQPFSEFIKENVIA